MKILVLNAGSGSQKCTLFEVSGDLPDEPPAPLWKAVVQTTAPGQSAPALTLTVERRGAEPKVQTLDEGASRHERLTSLLRGLWDGETAIISGPEQIDVIGHRIVHSGGKFAEAVSIDAAVERAIDEASAFAPLHNPSGLDGIRVARELFGNSVRHVAVFDTSFHRDIPEAAAVYPGPYEWVEQGIRRYGFHGASFRWAAERAATLLRRRDDRELRLILCHLGGGCSLAATVGGKSVDTTMGFTPLDGIAMCTRPGSLDPGILLFLLRQNPDIEALEATLNKQSGLAGLSGLPGDTRVVLPAAQKGDRRARLAMDVFIHRLKAGIGQMLASLGEQPDAIVFTDAISEDEPSVRAAACQPFSFLGMEVDPVKNDSSPGEGDIATADSKVRILVIRSGEDWQIAREAYGCCRS